MLKYDTEQGDKSKTVSLLETLALICVPANFLFLHFIFCKYSIIVFLYY